MQQSNNTANNHANIPLAMVPLQILQDVPWVAYVWIVGKLSTLESRTSICRIYIYIYIYIYGSCKTSLWTKGTVC
jgi:hypothetical protein